MGNSIYEKRTPKIFGIGQQTVVGNNTTAAILLAKNHQTSEFILECVIAQPYTIAPTGFNIDETLKRIELEVNGKMRVAASVLSIDSLNNLTEGNTLGRLVLDVPNLTAYYHFSVELHMETDGCPNDFLTMINSPSTLALTVTTGDNSAFVGGTMSAVVKPTYTINVVVRDYGVEHHYENGELMCSLREKVLVDNKSKTSGTPIMLDGKCATRFISLQTGLLVGTVFTPNDDIMTNIRITIDGKTTITTFYQLKNILARLRSFSEAGVSGFDFGDQLSGFAKSDSDIIIEYDLNNPTAAQYKIVVGHNAIREA